MSVDYTVIRAKALSWLKSIAKVLTYVLLSWVATHAYLSFALPRFFRLPTNCFELLEVPPTAAEADVRAAIERKVRTNEVDAPSLIERMQLWECGYQHPNYPQGPEIEMSATGPDAAGDSALEYVFEDDYLVEDFILDNTDNNIVISTVRVVPAITTFETSEPETQHQYGYQPRYPVQPEQTPNDKKVKVVEVVELVTGEEPQVTDGELHTENLTGDEQPTAAVKEATKFQEGMIDKEVTGVLVILDLVKYLLRKAKALSRFLYSLVTSDCSNTWIYFVETFTAAKEGLRHLSSQVTSAIKGFPEAVLTRIRESFQIAREHVILSFTKISSAIIELALIVKDWGYQAVAFFKGLFETLHEVCRSVYDKISAFFQGLVVSTEIYYRNLMMIGCHFFCSRA